PPRFPGEDKPPICHKLAKASEEPEEVVQAAGRLCIKVSAQSGDVFVPRLKAQLLESRYPGGTTQETAVSLGLVTLVSSSRPAEGFQLLLQRTPVFPVPETLLPLFLFQRLRNQCQIALQSR